MKFHGYSNHDNKTTLSIIVYYISRHVELRIARILFRSLFERLERYDSDDKKLTMLPHQ